MSKCDLLFKAIKNNKEQPNGVYVIGAVEVYTEDATATIEKKIPQGFNPEILVLELKIDEGSGPKKGRWLGFFYDERDVDMERVNQVNVVSSRGDNCTEDVELV